MCVNVYVYIYINICSKHGEIFMTQNVKFYIFSAGFNWSSRQVTIDREIIL